MNKRTSVTIFIYLVLTSSVLFVSNNIIEVNSHKTSYAALQGDCNSDSRVDILDFQLLSNSFGKSAGQTGYFAGCDFNASSSVDIIDFQHLSNNFGRTGTSTPTLPPPITPPPAGGGIWISRTEISSLPASGAAWDRLRSAAYGSWGSADLVNQDNKHDVGVLAGALVYAKTGDNTLREKVRQNIMPIIGQESRAGIRTLSLGRQLGAYVIAADLINLKDFASDDSRFRTWLSALRNKNIGGHDRWYSLVRTCENAANNWGTFACPSLLAAHLYLGDTSGVQRVANVFRAYLGERQYYPADGQGVDGYFQPSAGWDRTRTWACNESTWTGANPSCTKSGVNVDGAIVDDVSRGGSCCTIVGDGIGYSWEAIQGIYVTAEMLQRKGYDPYNWSDKALKRAMDFLYRNSSAWSGRWDGANYTLFMANKRYSANYPTTNEPATTGRIMAWTDWTHQ